MKIPLKGTLVLAGCGKMGGAMLEGWLKTGVPAKQIVTLDPALQGSTLELLKHHNIHHNPPITEIANTEALVVAVKPQVMGQVLPGLVPLLKSKPVVLSIAAGKTIASFEAVFGSGASIIRAMPNTPAAIGRGITALVGNRNVSPAQMALAEALLHASGEVVRVAREAEIDFVTAVSGSGPAYVFLLVETLAAAGEKLGLPADLAMRLARVTVSGAGELLYQSIESPTTLRQNVTSPKGTTEAALQVLMAPGGLKQLMEKAVAEAAKRSKELAL